MRTRGGLREAGEDRAGENRTLEMNWRSGLFRLWLVLSAIWIAGAFWRATTFTFIDLYLTYADKGLTPLDIRLDLAKHVLASPEEYIWIFGPPIAALAAGVLVLWI